MIIMKTIKISDKAWKLIEEHRAMLAKANKRNVSILEAIDSIFQDGKFFMPKNVKFRKMTAEEEMLEDYCGGDWQDAK